MRPEPAMPRTAVVTVAPEGRTSPLRLSQLLGEIEEFPEKVFDTETQPPEQPVQMNRDSSDIVENPSEKKISLSIEKLRKMVDEQDK